VGLGVVACKPKPESKPPPVKTEAPPPSIGASKMPETMFPERLKLIGPQACAQCHPDAVADWEGTHHQLANRPIDPALDNAAFVPARTLTDGGVTTKLSKQAGEYIARVHEADGSVTEHALNGVIAYEPLRQYLAPFPNGQWQTTSVAYDPALHEWFETNAGQDRLPGEWGHWAGQGMNWNANCAACHMTEYKKNYDWQTGKYDSSWLQQGISCAQCHTGLEAHVRDASKPGYIAPPSLKLSKQQVMDNCASCHSRRGQLTADEFKPGERYHDHYELSLPDQPGLYYADGQVLEEDFVYGSFQMSRMGHAGVSCLDCHNPHSLETILPVKNNLLCMRCHENGLDNAPVIQPTSHSHHPAGSTGNSCVECHMPHTTYMQRDPRRDHGFTSPDPLLTKELGIPNACNRCHDDESVDWAIEWSDKWYGEKLAGLPQRARARAVAAAHAGEPDAHAALLGLAATEENPAWQAVYAGLLRPWAGDPAVYQYLRGQLQADSPLLRSRATRSLFDSPQDVAPLLADDSRVVRLAATNALVSRTPLPEQNMEEWLAAEQFNSDRPQTAFSLAEHYLRYEQANLARTLIERGIELDERNGAVHSQAAVLYSRMGDNDRTEKALLRALELNPQDANGLYFLSLLRAEQGNFAETIALLNDVVAVEPGFERAWYNLALAYTKVGNWEAADAALKQAPGMSRFPAYIQTRRIIDQQLGK